MSEPVDPTPSTSSPPKTASVPFTFKRKSRPQSSRKRTPSPDEAPSSSVVKPTQRTTLNPLLQGTKRIREARKRERDADEQFKADESFTVGGDELVTRSAEWDLTGDTKDDSGRIKRPRLDEDGNILPSDGTYKGLGSYSNFIKLDERQAQMSSKMKAGPQKASANIRSITVTDYQPDVCKDYKGESNHTQAFSSASSSFTNSRFTCRL
jgi:RING finger protein 113A